MDFARLTSFIDSLEEEYSVPGCGVTVWREHQPVYTHVCGVSDYEKTVPVTQDDVYYIYSATKLSTCVCALQLIEQGKLRLNDEVAKYLPAFKNVQVKANGALVPAKAPITIWNLLTMTGGLNYNCESGSITAALKSGKTSTLELVSAIAGEPLEFQPGECFKYSLCHDVLGGVIEAASGRRLRDYMRENLFEPLDMTRTGFDLGCTSALYEWAPEGIKPLDGCKFRFTPDYDSGGAGLSSTLTDYIRLMDMLACDGVGATGSRVLDESSVRLMRKNQLKGEGLAEFQRWKPHYGYGLGVRTLLDESAAKSPFGEFGWDGAAGMYALADAKNRLSVFFVMHIVDYRRIFENAHPALRDIVYECMGF